MEVLICPHERSRLYAAAFLRGQAGVLFENSIVCLVVFVCCFCLPLFPV